MLRAAGWFPTPQSAKLIANTVGTRRLPSMFIDTRPPLVFLRRQRHDPAAPGFVLLLAKALAALEDGGKFNRQNILEGPQANSFIAGFGNLRFGNPSSIATAYSLRR